MTPYGKLRNHAKNAPGGLWKPLYEKKGVSRPIYVNVNSPNLGFPYFLGGYQ